MDETLFAELMESANEALEHAKGRRSLKTVVLPPPPEPMSADDVRELRARLDASQAVFASYLNVSTKLVQAWEADRRTPEGAALRLLRLA
jgi:putative transcriptional regulator